ncbi:MAG TPA: ATP-binding protein [Xanthobacteraceae bacterium]|nr:ATP-binding protein [Xanthobacteraceae bacterium]
MTFVESELALLRDPRLAALATSPWPAWLWSADASGLLWANAAGAALFGAADTRQCVARRFDTDNPAAAQIIRLAATLPSAGPPRLERLRGFGLGFGRALTCACSRLVVTDGNAAVLIAAAEPAGPALSLAERVRRLFADDEPLAAFTADGALVHTTEAARAQLGGANSLSALGIQAAAAKALDVGSATALLRLGQKVLESNLQRIGDGPSRVLVLGLPQSQAALIEAADVTPSAAIAASATPEAAVTAPPSAPPVSQTASPAEPIVERRHPLRFVWQMDADGRFVVGSDEFIALVGPKTTAAFGRTWSEISAELKLDPDNQIARAVASHETWSGIVIPWPVDETSDRLPVELSGLPVFDRDRSFRGYRGFGVCRDLARINQLARARRERPIGFMPAPEADDTAPASPQNPAAAGAATRPERPALNIAPAAANVVPFRQAPPVEPKAPTLSPVERRAFRELAQELNARLRGTPEAPPAAEPSVEGALAEAPKPPDQAAESAAALPSSEELLPANDAERPAAAEATGAAVVAQPAAVIDPSLLDRLPIGVLVYRHDALLYANRHFLETTGYDDLTALGAAGGLNSLFVERGADTLAESTGTQALSIMTGRGDTVAVDARLFSVPWNGASALALIVSNGLNVVGRRATELALAAAETELRNAKRETQKSAAAKADFLAKISHEIRTPLNAMTGFAEVMMAERFGPIGNERYRDYLKDIHGAGAHLVSLLNDLLDLSKVETGKLDLSFGNVGVNDLTQQCVGIMQPQANRARIIIRTSLTPALPQVVADERSLRQIVLNLLANSIKFTGPGGQVIVSTAVSDSSEVVLRVRDTGVGMSEKDIEAALEPFRQVATSGSWGSGGTGLGLPLTKALAEANRANFNIKSAPNAGTLVEIAFPPSRVVTN